MRKTMIGIVTVCFFGSMQSFGQTPILSSFLKDGPIVTGRVSKIKPPVLSTDGAVTVTVTGQLRGKPLPTSVITVPYMMVPANPKYPKFGWNRNPPVEGESVLLFLTGDSGAWIASEVLNLDGEDAKLLPTIREMIALENAGLKGNQEVLFDALNKGPHELRSLATEMLLNRVCARNNACRMKTLQSLAAIAGNSGEPVSERTWAVSTIAHGVYVGLTPADPVDMAALTKLSELLANRDASVRGEAIANMWGLLLSGSEPTKSSIPLTSSEKMAILKQLDTDSKSSSPYSGQARDLLQFFGRQS